MMELAQALRWLSGAKLHGDPRQPIQRVHSDTRSLRAGDLFVAIQGEKFDANQFLAQAKAAGAAATLCSDAAALDAAGMPGIVVADTRQALGDLARGWRALEKAVAITNQPGDTRGEMTVKDLRERGSQTVKNADNITTVGGATVAVGAGAEVMDKVDQIEQASGIIERIRYAVDPFLGFIADHKWLVLILIGVAVIYLAHRIKKRRLFDAITWRHVG